MARFKPFRRRARKAGEGLFLLKHAKAWRALVKAARYQARAPLACADGLTAAAAKAFSAVVPPGHRRPDSDFLRLQMLGRSFAALPGDQREARAAELVNLADRVQAALDQQAPPPPPGRSPRADIFG